MWSWIFRNQREYSCEEKLTEKKNKTNHMQKITWHDAVLLMSKVWGWEQWSNVFRIMKKNTDNLEFYILVNASTELRLSRLQSETSAHECTLQQKAPPKHLNKSRKTKTLNSGNGKFNLGERQREFQDDNKNKSQNDGCLAGLRAIPPDKS